MLSVYKPLNVDIKISVSLKTQMFSTEVFARLPLSGLPSPYFINSFFEMLYLINPLFLVPIQRLFLLSAVIHLSSFVQMEFGLLLLLVNLLNLFSKIFNLFNPPENVETQKILSFCWSIQFTPLYDNEFESYGSDLKFLNVYPSKRERPPSVAIHK